MSKKLKLLVVGLDGATFDIIDPILEKLPNIKRLIGRGVKGTLQSTIPPMSPAAWATFMTGQDPGKHGIFHWRGFDLTDYSCLDEKFVSSSFVAGKTFFDYLGEAGYKTAVITVPITHPTWPINGIMVAGYPCPDTQKNYTWPPEYSDKLKASYNLSADHYLHATEDEIIEKGLWLLKERTALAINLIENENVDACILVLGEIDRAQHNFWKYRDPTFPEYHTKKGEKYRHTIEAHYIACDEHIARLLKKVDNMNTTVIIMSDHGGGPVPQKSFLTNSWLVQKEFLSLKEHNRDKMLQNFIAKFHKIIPYENKLRELLPKKYVQKVRQIYLGHSNIDWSKTIAYRFPMYHPSEGIAINLKGRQSEGIVDPKDYEIVREKIINELKLAKDLNGNLIVEKIYKREDIYSTLYLSHVPDVVFITNPKIKTDAAINLNTYIRDTDNLSGRISGTHLMEGIFIASGKNMKCGHMINNMSIANVAPTILYDQGQPIPLEMTGKICWEAFKDEYKSKVKPEFTHKDHTPTSGVSIDAEGKLQIEAKLKSLGYM